MDLNSVDIESVSYSIYHILYIQEISILERDMALH